MAQVNLAKRIRWSFLIFLVLGLIITIRLFFLQVISGEYFRTLAVRQYNFFGDISPRRGDIFLTDKNNDLYSAASTKEGYLLYINPDKLVDSEDAYAKLKNYLELDKEDFIMRAAKKADPYEVISHKIDKKIAEKVNALKITGVGTAPEEWRSYPSKTLASHVLGFLGYKNDELEGRYGVERYYEDVLKGKAGYISDNRSGAGMLIDIGRNFFSPPSEGYDVVLTLERNVQAYLEKNIEEIDKKWKPSEVGGIILEPATGKILAMAAYPNFDPNSYGKTESLETFKNPLVENIYEFGSVYKPLTIAAGINEKLVTPETTYKDEGFVAIDGAVIKNFDGRGRGTINLQRVINESLNTGAVFVAQKLGKENMRKYFLNFGIGEKTEITLPGEVSGNVSNLYSKHDVEYFTASFGQGVATTPLAFVKAFSALANGGKLMRPYIVERVVRPGMGSIINEPKMEREVISPETAESITTMLVKAVDEALLAGKTKFKNWTSAAKTGTAEIPLKDKKGYSNESLHSFIAFAPAYNAKFILFLYMLRPQGNAFSSVTLAPYYEDIMRFLLTYYEIPPDR